MHRKVVVEYEQVAVRELEAHAARPLRLADRVEQRARELLAVAKGRVVRTVRRLDARGVWVRLSRRFARRLDGDLARDGARRVPP